MDIFHLTKKWGWNHHPLKGWVFKGGIQNVLSVLEMFHFFVSRPNRHTWDRGFLQDVQKQYHNIPYHNQVHAADVLSSCTYFLREDPVTKLCHCFLGMCQYWINKIFWRWLIFWKKGVDFDDVCGPTLKHIRLHCTMICDICILDRLGRYR